VNACSDASTANVSSTPARPTPATERVDLLRQPAPRSAGVPTDIEPPTASAPFGSSAHRAPLTHGARQGPHRTPTAGRLRPPWLRRDRSRLSLKINPGRNRVPGSAAPGVGADLTLQTAGSGARRERGARALPAVYGVSRVRTVAPAARNPASATPPPPRSPPPGRIPTSYTLQRPDPSTPTGSTSEAAVRRRDLRSSARGRTRSTGDRSALEGCALPGAPRTATASSAGPFSPR
jgi:hypothetical protein